MKVILSKKKPIKYGLVDIGIGKMETCFYKKIIIVVLEGEMMGIYSRRKLWVV